MSQDTHPPDNRQQPTRVRDRWIGILMLAEIASSIAIGQTVIEQTLALPDPTVAALVVAGIVGAAALLVVVLAVYVLIRGVKIR